MTPLRAALAENHPEVMLLEPPAYDAAIVGIVERINLQAVAYDATALVRIIAEVNGWPHEDAQEWFDVNTSGAYMGAHSPVFLYKTQELLSA